MSNAIKKGILLMCLCICLVGIGFASAGMAAGGDFAAAMKMGFCISLAVAAFMGAIVAIVTAVYFFQKNI